MTTLESIGNKQDQGSDQNKSKDPFDLDIPGYRIVGQCGGGSTAKVYVAIQKSLGRQVALKVMLSSDSIDEMRIKRFIKEGLVNARLSHPNIVTMHEVGVIGEYNYIAMEYLPWGSLRTRLTEKLEFDWILNVVEQIASALAYAHENGFVHRDIKPENILFRNEFSAVLSDFGIATVIDSRIQVSDRCNFGTPRYMSPDQINLTTVGPSSDVYSLGVVFFEMLTGLPPYNEGDSKAIRSAHLLEPIPKLPKECKHLQPIINKMLAKHPQDRINNANELLEILVHLKKSKNLSSGIMYRGVETSSNLQFSDQANPFSGLNSKKLDLLSHITEDLSKNSSQSFKFLPAFFKLFSKKKQNNKVKIKGLFTSLGNTVVISIVLGLASFALFLVHISGTDMAEEYASTDKDIQIAHDKYLGWAVHSIKNMEIKRAKYFIEKAREVNPDDLVSKELLYSLNKQNNLSEFQFNDLSDSINLTENFADEFIPVDKLLIRAKQQVRENNLTTPPYNNAYDTYLLILKSEPDNSEAIAGIAMIKRIYVNWAEEDVKKNNFYRAVLFYKKALTIDPQDSKLAQVLKELKSMKGTS